MPANVHTAPDPLANVAAYIEHYQLEEVVSSALKDVVKSRTRTPILAMIDSLSRAKKVEMAAKHAAATQIQAHCRGHTNRVCRGKSVGHIGTRVKVLVSMDPGQDLDDEMFLILLSARAYVEYKGGPDSASWLSGGCSQVVPSFGQPRPASRLGRAGRPYRACFPHRRWPPALSWSAWAWWRCCSPPRCEHSWRARRSTSSACTTSPCAPAPMAVGRAAPPRRSRYVRCTP